MMIMNRLCPQEAPSLVGGRHTKEHHHTSKKYSIQGLPCAVAEMTHEWLTTNKVGVHLGHIFTLIWLYRVQTCGIGVYVEDTQSVTFFTPVLLLVNFLVPWLPWMVSQDFSIPDHFFGFREIRVWDREKKEKKRKEEREEKRREGKGRENARQLRRKDRGEIHITEFSVLDTLQPPTSFCFSSDMFNSFPSQGLCTYCAATQAPFHTSLPQGGLYHCSHSWSFMLLLLSLSLFPCVALLYFTEFFASWNHTICCDYLLLQLLVTGFLATRIYEDRHCFHFHSSFLTFLFQKTQLEVLSRKRQVSKGERDAQAPKGKGS